MRLLYLSLLASFGPPQASRITLPRDGYSVTLIHSFQCMIFVIIKYSIVNYEQSVSQTLAEVKSKLVAHAGIEPALLS